jgi:hypothetical protein
MKIALLLGLPIFISTQFFADKKPHSKETFYYFCVSHSKSSETNKSKEIILYTSVLEIICEEKEIRLQATKWGDFVDKNCQNESGCTSDLNYYPTKEDAEVQFQKMKEHYKNSQKFTLNRVEFN